MPLQEQATEDKLRKPIPNSGDELDRTEWRDGAELVVSTVEGPSSEFIKINSEVEVDLENWV